VTFQIECHAVAAPATLEAEWRAIEERAAPSFFQSWSWMGGLVESVSRLPDCVAPAARIGCSGLPCSTITRVASAWLRQTDAMLAQPPGGNAQSRD
jgi:hypothetical protein